jgi:hypothetical protein
MVRCLEQALTRATEEVPVTVGVRRVDHVSMAVWNIDEQIKFFKDVFGWQEAGRFRSEEAGFAGVVLDVPGADGRPQMQWEILEPIAKTASSPRSCASAAQACIT